jgi:hypothetical protein
MEALSQLFSADTHADEMRRSNTAMLLPLCKRGTNILELVNVKFRLTCKNGSFTK